MFIEPGALAEAAAGADVCVVGSGPAGITLAVALGRAGVRTLLLEGGVEGFDEASQDLYVGEVVGDRYFRLEEARLRMFGGSSNHWSGMCRHMDEVDFEPKAAFPLAHWPIRKADIDPYLGETLDILEMRVLAEDEILDAEAGIKRIDFAFTDRVNFAYKFEDEIAASQQIRCALGANVTLIRTDGRRVTGLEVRDFEGGTTEIVARRYVLATGGIENSRLLLWSNEVQNGALFPERMPVGRYWMEHHVAHLGSALVPDQGGQDRFYSLTPEAQGRLGVLNCGLRFFPLEETGTRGLIRDLACVAPDLSTWAANQFDRRLICGVRLDAAWEQEPLEENRVSLSATARDRFDMPRVELHWRRSLRDVETVRESALALGRFFGKENGGRVKLRNWVFGRDDFPSRGEFAGYHHMGGTRMAESDSVGVVDGECRMSSQENLWIAGSSVFPSGGHANPTQTIVQLSLRLAERLRNAA